MGEQMKPAVVKLGTPPFSSPDPKTIGLNPTLVHVETGEPVSSAPDAGDGEDKKAADWKADVEAATNQDELDAVAQAYEESGADFKTVESAIEKKQEEINEAAEGGK